MFLFVSSVVAMSNSFEGSVNIAENLTIEAGHVFIDAGDLHLDGDLIHDIGEVSFSGGNFSIDDDTFFINPNNNRIGIGTYEPDQKLDINGSFIADKIYLTDSGSDYMGWGSGDGVFKLTTGLDVGGTLFANDISGGDWTGATIDATDEVMTPLIYNTDGDTLTIDDNLDVIGTIGNSEGILKLNPEAQYDVELFGDTDVGNGENGKIFKVWRRAAEGNDYVRFYCSSGRVCYIHSSNKLTLQAQNPFTINSVTDDIIFKVGDNSGGRKFYFKDSDGDNVARINSDGDADFIGDVGIGTTSPTQKLDVSGSIKVDDTYLFSDGSTQTSAQDGFLGHISTAVFKQEVDIESIDSSPRDMQLKPDGTKIYISGVEGNGIVWEYDLTDPWNISSMVYNSKNFNVETWESNPMGLFIRHDGKKMYVCGSGGDEVNEFNLETAWDITSAQWVSLFDVSGKETQPAGVEFRPDGKKMYIIGTSSDAVNEYDLSTAWDITSATWNQEFGTDIDAATGFSFKQDGTRMYVMDGSAEDDIHEYVLSTPWDISSASLERLFNVNSENSVPQDIAFSPDLTKAYMVGSGSPASVFEYDLGISINGKLKTSSDVNLSGLLYVNESAGYVGMGTTNPIFMLDIRQPDDKQAAFVDTRTQATGTGGGIILGGYYTDTNDLALAGEIRASKVNSISGDYGFDMTFATQENGGSITERIRIESGGDVGIGTDNPTSTLDIHGELSFAQTLGDKISLYNERIGDTNMYGFGVEASSALYAKSYSSHRWYINSNADEGVSAKMQLDTTGLGLGTNDPAEEFHINSSNPQIIFEEYDGANSEKVWEMGATNEEFLIKTQSDVYGASQTVFRIGCRGGTSIGCIDFPHGDVTISDLSGSGNDYACLDSTGKLFRSNAPC